MELLGFFVLGAPLIFIVVWLVIATPVSLLYAKRFSDKETVNWKRRAKLLSIITLIVMLPFWDAIIGKVYLSYLCTFEGGPKVYHTVELPSEYWGEDSNPLFILDNGGLDESILNNKIDKSSKTVPHNRFLGISAIKIQIYEINNEILLGEVVIYKHDGGWFSRKLGGIGWASMCDNYRGKKFWREHYLSIFKQPKLTVE